jgi:very-short-patch-repair endonuclease
MGRTKSEGEARSKRRAKVDDRIHELALHQHGLISAPQAVDKHVSKSQVRTRLERASLRRAAPGVYATMGSPSNWEQLVLAACLAAGPNAVASHRSAAVLWELIDPPGPVELVVPRARCPEPPGATVHRSTDLRDQDIGLRKGIPVTNPIRTVADLGAVAPELVATAVERGLYKRLFTTKALWQIVDDLGKRGRSGIGVLRRMLEERALGDARACSPLEPLFAAIAASIGVRLSYQHPVAVEGHRYVVDFALAEIKVAIEIDGLEVHATRAALDADLARQNHLVLAGWHLLRYTATHLVRRRAAIKAELQQLVAQRRH